jgi:hypothetical protein
MRARNSFEFLRNVCQFFGSASNPASGAASAPPQSSNMDLLRAAEKKRACARYYLFMLRKAVRQSLLGEGQVRA